MTLGVRFILALAAGTYLLRLAGLVLVHRGLPAALSQLLPLVPAALFAGLVVINGLTTDGAFRFGERIGGLVVAAVLAHRGKGLGLVVVSGVAATALLRFLGPLVFG